MTIPRVLLGLLIVIALSAAAFVAYAWRLEIAPVERPAPGGFDRAQVSRGRALAAIGNCATCHTADGGTVLAGGRPFKTPFGTLYSPNITPDAETGIGRWSQAAFARAMREGVDREGRHLYPAFPYDHFTLVTDADNQALYAYLMSQAPAKALSQSNALAFPFNVRMTVAAWKLLYFKQGPYRQDRAQNANWNRGAYLVEGLAHCGACHTPRNILGAEKPSERFDGADIDGWHAYAINARSAAPTPWTAEAMAFYLRSGWHQAHGMARGPMAPVVENLAAVPIEDTRAIATYIAAATERARPGGKVAEPVAALRKPTPASADSLVSPRDVPAGSSDAGAKIYAAACATCHEAGRPLPFGGIDLAHSTAIHGESPRNLINVTLYGLPATAGEASAIMPGFRASLTDPQIASLVHYLRADIAKKPAWPSVEPMIREARSSDTAPPLYTTPGTQGAPNDPNQGGVAW